MKLSYEPELVILADDPSGLIRGNLRILTDDTLIREIAKIKLNFTYNNNFNNLR